MNNNDVLPLAGPPVLSPDPTWLDKRLAGKTTFATTPGWRRALQMVLDMKAANCFGPGVEAVGIPQMESQFASEQAIMMYTSPALDGPAKALNPKIR